tara:strand:- start:31197 stop:32645 length:1449 start_codon:yes stop_codon:yes gene_type:complete
MKNSNEKWNLKNTYSTLPDCFYKKIKPTLVQNPKIFFFNKSLAKKLNLDFLNYSPSLIAEYLSGNKLPKGSCPIAQAYAGHQFGHFTMLGDGRAILLGEQKARNKKLYDIQLKGSGKTPFSRNGDGRATLSSMLREYIISESMHYLKIPTSRSLAVLGTGEKVSRNLIADGGILTRVVSSHIRVGTFEYGRNFCKQEDFQKFIDYVIERHYPEILHNKLPYLELLKIIMKKQIDLIVEWNRVGFIHGVMNTDNMSILGETIDYGPCAFMNSYNPKTVFSSIDRNGRYSFGNQHKIAYWNLSVFAGTILSFIENDKNKAIELAQNVLNQFPVEYSNKWYQMMYRKLGIINPIEEDKLLIKKIFSLMEFYKADYTNTFAALTLKKTYKDPLSKTNEFSNWKKRWMKRIKNEKNSYEIMRKNNPIYIPRNHLVESALENAINGNKKEFEKILSLMSQTYNYSAKHDGFQTIPNNFDETYKTFCGT